MDILSLTSSSAGNCYRISDGVTTLLFEAGIPIQKIKQRLNYKLSDIAGCLVTHGHADHCKSVRDLLKIGIDVYASAETLQTVDAVDEYTAHIIVPSKQFAINTFIVMPFETQHDCPGSVGYLIYSTITKERLVFITDSFYCRYRFKDLNYIMVECNYATDILQANIDSNNIPRERADRLLKSHFSLEHVKQFLAANDLSYVKEIYLLHLSAGNSDAARFKREVQAVTGKIVIVCNK